MAGSHSETPCEKHVVVRYGPGFLQLTQGLVLRSDTKLWKLWLCHTVSSVIDGTMGLDSFNNQAGSGLGCVLEPQLSDHVRLRRFYPL